MYVLLIVSLCASIYVCVCVFVCVHMDTCIQSCGQAVNHHTFTIMHIHTICALAYACHDAKQRNVSINLGQMLQYKAISS